MKNKNILITLGILLIIAVPIVIAQPQYIPPYDNEDEDIEDDVGFAIKTNYDIATDGEYLYILHCTDAGGFYREAVIQYHPNTTYSDTVRGGTLIAGNCSAYNRTDSARGLATVNGSIFFKLGGGNTLFIGNVSENDWDSIATLVNYNGHFLTSLSTADGRYFYASGADAAGGTNVGVEFLKYDLYNATSGTYKSGNVTPMYDVNMTRYTDATTTGTESSGLSVTNSGNFYAVDADEAARVNTDGSWISSVNISYLDDQYSQMIVGVAELTNEHIYVVTVNSTNQFAPNTSLGTPYLYSLQLQGIKYDWSNLRDDQYFNFIRSDGSVKHITRSCDRNVDCTMFTKESKVLYGGMNFCDGAYIRRPVCVARQCTFQSEYTGGSCDKNYGGVTDRMLAPMAYDGSYGLDLVKGNMTKLGETQ